MVKKIFSFLVYLFLIGYFLFLIGSILTKDKKKTNKINDIKGSQVLNLNQNRTTTVFFPSKAIEKEADYYISPNGNDKNDGRNPKTPFFSIQKAVNLAKPGEKIYLFPGVYFQDIETVRDGLLNNPIEITGDKNAIVKGGGKTNIVNIRHSFIIIYGFTIDGRFKEENSAESYRDKLIFVSGQSFYKPTRRVIIKNMSLKNARGECVRIKYFSQENEVAYNQINNCGIGDFVFSGSGKNGEGIYIGTAPEQLKTKNPSPEMDYSNNNWIHHNTINTQGNECVEIKEGSSGNIIEYNDCVGQKDPNSGGMASRGNSNTFRFNTISDNLGAGIRLGGDLETDGINNSIYGNVIVNNKEGGIKIQTSPQGKICENILRNNGKGFIVGKFKDYYKNENKCL